MRDRLDVPTLVLAATVTAALANVAQHAAVDARVSDWYEAVQPKAGHDLRVLAEGHFDATRERFLLPLQLGEHAPGATLALPAGHGLVEEELRGLGRAGAVEVLGEVRALGPSAADGLAAAVVATGTDAALGPYRIAVADDPPSRMVAVTADGATWLVDERLLPAHEEGAA